MLGTFPGTHKHWKILIILYYYPSFLQHIDLSLAFLRVWDTKVSTMDEDSSSHTIYIPVWGETENNQ